MAKEKKQSEQTGELIVKNKKFKKSDILAFGICLAVALVIWVYATNVEMKVHKEPEIIPAQTEASEQI